jgi:transducin (beta)-like 1
VSGFFGPVTPTSPTAAADEDDFENARKRQIDNEQPQIQNEPPVKRPRLSNGYENGFDSTPMDVDEDQNGNGNAYPSPEQAPSPVVVTIGPEQGTQVDKVAELGTETMFLDLSEDSSTRNPILLQCEWNPRDPTILAAAGTEALARMWTLSRTGTDSQSNMQLNPVVPPHQNLLDDNVPSTTIVTGISWSSEGRFIAVASEPVDDGTARIDFWSVDGTRIAGLDGFESPVICLQWNLENSACLALSFDNGGANVLLTVMYPATEELVRYSLPLRHSLSVQLLEAAWISNDEFVICGGETLQALHCVDGAISPVRKYETREGHTLSKVTFDWRSRLLATASDTGIIDVSFLLQLSWTGLNLEQIWDQQGQCHSFNAHQGVITSLIWQPMQFPTALGDDVERLLVSAGEDGAISIWNARSAETKSRCSMTMSSAVVALAFTPDGAFIAGATTERILIWKVDDVHIPRASWIRGPELGWQTPQSHESTPDEDQHCLCWDAHGQKLAYGVNSQVCSIQFAPCSTRLLRLTLCSWL